MIRVAHIFSVQLGIVPDLLEALWNIVECRQIRNSTFLRRGFKGWQMMAFPGVPSVEMTQKGVFDHWASSGPSFGL